MGAILQSIDGCSCNDDELCAWRKFLEENATEDVEGWCYLVPALWKLLDCIEEKSKSGIRAVSWDCWYGVFLFSENQFPTPVPEGIDPVALLREMYVNPGSEPPKLEDPIAEANLDFQVKALARIANELNS